MPTFLGGKVIRGILNFLKTAWQTKALAIVLEQKKKSGKRLERYGLLSGNGGPALYIVYTLLRCGALFGNDDYYE